MRCIFFGVPFQTQENRWKSNGSLLLNQNVPMNSNRRLSAPAKEYFSNGIYYRRYVILGAMIICVIDQARQRFVLLILL